MMVETLKQEAEKSQKSLQEQLDIFFQKCADENIDELDAFLTLGERGVTLDDFKNTSYYEYAKEFSKTHSWY